MTDEVEKGSLAVARAYHAAWTAGEVDEAGRYLADDLTVDVPLNVYPTKADFLAAVRSTREMTSRVDLLSAVGTDDEAVLIYDMFLPIGALRVAEHFTVAVGRITHIRHVHDTAALRAAGFGAAGAAQPADAS
jgi:SnoaL-like domain